MAEIELKLQVSPQALAGVEREVALGSSRRVRLQAVYFDTADHRLAAAGLVLRLRKEGRRWVQTLKRGSAHGLEREEHDAPRAVPAGLEPSADLALHAESPAGRALAALLAADREGHTPRLLPLYRTDVWRRLRVLRTRGGAVELALDRGEIRATGPDGVERRWPVCELEVELLRGPPSVVTDVAARWASRHGLWIDTRSKSERGDRLSRGFGPGEPVPIPKAAPLRWHKSMRPADAWRAILASTLAQALPQWNEWTGGSRAPEVVHQLRVALRRLRSGRRFVEGWPGVGGCAWEEQAKALFRRLGEVRDQDVLSAGLLCEVEEALAQCGAAPLPAAAPGDAPAWTDAERAQQGRVFIELLAELVAPAAGPVVPVAPVDPVDPTAQDGPRSTAGAASAIEPAQPTAPSLRALAATRLQDWHRTLRKDAKRFAEMDDESRHRTRKRLKRLRYAVEFSAGLFPRGRVEAYLERLREAQERLGEYNDLCLAIAHWEPLAAEHPQAWFALGWLAARRDAVLGRCADALAHWRKAEPFWD